MAEISIWDGQMPVSGASLTNRYQWATVSQVNPLRIRLDGETAAIPVTPDSIVSPRDLSVNDRVWVQIFGRRLLVQGRSDGPRGSRTMRCTSSTTTTITGATTILWDTTTVVNEIGMTRAANAYDWAVPAGMAGTYAASFYCQLPIAATRSYIQITATGRHGSSANRVSVTGEDRGLAVIPAIAMNDGGIFTAQCYFAAGAATAMTGPWIEIVRIGD